MRRASGAGFGNQSVLGSASDMVTNDLLKRKMQFAGDLHRPSEASMIELDESRAAVKDCDDHLEQSIDTSRNGAPRTKRSSRFVSGNSSLINYVPTLHVRKNMSPETSRDRSKLSLKEHKIPRIKIERNQGLRFTIPEFVDQPETPVGLKSKQQESSDILGQPSRGQAISGVLQSQSNKTTCPNLAESCRLIHHHIPSLSVTQATLGSVKSVSSCLNRKKIALLKISPHQGDCEELASSPHYAFDISIEESEHYSRRGMSQAMGTHRRRDSTKMTVITVKRTTDSKKGQTWVPRMSNQLDTSGRVTIIGDAGCVNYKLRPVSHIPKVSVLDALRGIYKVAEKSSKVSMAKHH